MGMPEHIAIIMDGNGRWASRRGLLRASGHRAGAKSARGVVESARKNDVKVLTLFAFSSENWQRPRAEVQILMTLFRRTLRRQLPDLVANGVRLSFIGERSRLSAALRTDMADAESRTRDNDVLDLVIALDYGGRWDIAQAARALADACDRGDLAPGDIDEKAIGQQMSLCRFGQPDLFIRTGGERRVSNFLLWDLAYSELYFTDCLWPDFDARALRDAIEWYAQRERRFGGLPAAAAPEQP